MRPAKATIVGAGGFLGRACTRALQEAGFAVTAVDIAPNPGDNSLVWVEADILTHGLPQQALDGVDVLLNLAWRNNPGRGNADMEHDVSTNLAGAVRVFEQAARAGVRRIVYTSSGGTVYGKAPLPTNEDQNMAPIGGYGAGKAAAELYLNAIHHAYGVQSCVLRIANPYGPGQLPNRGQGFIATAVARTLAGQPIEIFGSGEISRDYVYIDDVAHAVALAAMDDTPQLLVNVGSGHDLSLDALIPLIFEAAGRETEVSRMAGRPMDVPRMALDISKIEALLGWRPTTSIAEGLKATVLWLEKNIKPAG